MSRDRPAPDDPALAGLERALSEADLADDPDWQAVAAGALAPAQAAERIAGDDPIGAELAALFAPLDAAVLDRVERAVADAADRDPPGADPALAGLERALAEADGEGEDEDGRMAALLAPLDAAAIERIERAVAPAEPAPPARVLRFPTRRAAVVGAGLALAAALALFALRSGPELPRYAIELSAGDRAVRGDDPPAERPVFRRDSTLALVVRPARAVDSAPPVTIELVGAERHPVALPTRPSPAGALLYTGPAAPLFVAPPGDYTLRITLGPAGDAQVVEHPLRLVGDEP